MIKTKLLSRLDAFSIDRQSFVNQLNQLTPEQLSTRPTPGSWSILEIVEHLVLAEKIVFKGFPDPESLIPIKKGLSNRLLYRVVIFILKSRRFKVDVPDKNMKPTGLTSLSDLLGSWNQNQIWLREFILNRSQPDLKKAVFIHPVSGPITPSEAIYMLQIHFDKHMHQIQGILSTLETQHREKSTG
ncbi:MAG: DinB family protein [Rhodothermaceae bacterium]|nr:DinB family protein [Rhodothermaceae bacterium]